ncbi:methyl-accepting chemotaxis protein [Vibrio cholerae]|uniref:methyl-accepting chemotaxis protein n=1 Tax=Vibrio cholerae TaxID=666 RepID=UPI0011D7AD0D|nr:methyl-accepting chemotaxis protein [Vibrio cholerae]EGR4059411.1 methyl-accepting chemotaxis protein [Vibrio cholerae]EGR4154779.1 methyl-accepting chemotaxis protein [Vibrio cholerae]EGR4417214.1 methyl-accepting chemotaxis protein [Vibrio cholerae]EJL6346020.1 PAS domain-containing protein [Vibrio cholerae]TXZ26562.1 PAS domain-containing protein [Vibrio cholerae]
MGLLARLFSTAPHHPTQPAEVKPDPLMQSPVATETTALQPEPQVAPYQTDLALTTPESDLTPQVNQAFVQVIREHLALLECEPNGTICYANDAFAHLCRVSAEAMVGADFANLWRTHQQPSVQRLLQDAKKGHPVSAELQLNRPQEAIWIKADLYPIKAINGQLQNVVVLLQDITAAKLEKIDRSGQMNAVNLTQAVIEFMLDGTILTANQNFLQTVGYQLDEIQGRHHSMFVDEQYKQSQEYQHFWQRLRSGEFFVDEYKRFGKGGKEIWIQASYNPIMDSEGKPYKVVKYATNVTQRKMVVNEVKRVMTALSSGDLSAQLTHPFEGEFAELGEVISQFIVTLRQIITDINSVAATIKLAATEISNGNTDLSSRTEQQASNLEQTAASGGELIEQVVVTMASINESAQKIADIIGVIDGIAFQTNILALNAAVEAARAGEQGRGFSVVASEVRSLAQRSANAAKDIKALISDSVSKISNGNELVDRSGSTMKDIVVSIKRVHDLMADIASASAEQATGINEVNQAVNQMDEMTQQNAALVEEAAAASESLLAQAEQLYDHVAMFRLPDQDTSVPSPLKAVNKRAQSAPVTRHPASHIAKTPAKITAKASSRAQPAMQVAHDEEWESF